MKLSLRDLLWLMVVVGIGCLAWINFEQGYASCLRDIDLVCREALIDRNYILMKVEPHPNKHKKEVNILWAYAGDENKALGYPIHKGPRDIGAVSIRIYWLVVWSTVLLTFVGFISLAEWYYRIRSKEERKNDT